MPSLATFENKIAKLKERPEVVPIARKPKRRDLPSVLMRYQARWFLDDSPLKLWEKSRRIGASWVEALKSVWEATKRGRNRSTIYICYNKDSTEQFVRDCEFWVRNLNLVSTIVSKKPILDERRDVLGYQIRFNTGRVIKALSGKPNNIRGKQARVVIDEAGFVEDLKELLKAALALLMWGGSVSILSTHNGADNEFNELVEQIKSGESEGWSHHKTNLDDALADGLYKRICLVTGKEWTLEGEFAWRAKLIADYGVSADEELMAIPFAGRAGKVFNSEKLTVIDYDTIPEHGEIVRFWDIAATEKDLKEKKGGSKNDPCATAGMLMKRAGNKFYILDLKVEYYGVAGVDDLMRSTAEEDGRSVPVRWEQEGGSAGIRDAAHIAANLAGFDAAPVRPQGDKVKRAKPWASQVNQGNVFMVRAPWNNQLKKWLYAFPDGKMKDVVDSGSGAFSFLTAIKDEPQPSGSWSGW